MTSQKEGYKGKSPTYFKKISHKYVCGSHNVANTKKIKNHSMRPTEATDGHYTTLSNKVHNTSKLLRQCD